MSETRLTIGYNHSAAKRNVGAAPIAAETAYIALRLPDWQECATRVSKYIMEYKPSTPMPAIG